jgi:hypothetical protein
VTSSNVVVVVLLVNVHVATSVRLALGRDVHLREAHKVFQDQQTHALHDKKKQDTCVEAIAPRALFGCQMGRTRVFVL